MPQLNKAEKFVKRQFKMGKTRTQVYEAIFEKLTTWNFPPEYNEAFAKFDPLFDRDEVLQGSLLENQLGEFICADCGDIHDQCCCWEEPCVLCQKLPCECLTIKLPKLPDPDSPEYENMIDFMRADLETDMSYSKVIAAAEKIFADKGLDLYEEFEKDQKRKRGEA